MLPLRILRGSAVAAGTFLVGAPFVFWFAPDHRPASAAAPHPVLHEVMDRHDACGTELEGLSNLNGRLVARRVPSEEEGVSRTEIVSVGSGRTEVIRTLQFCFPVAWSPVDEGVLLLREAAADDDERNFAINIHESTMDRKYLGCRHCRFRDWSADRDVLHFNCPNGPTQVLDASGRSPLTVAAETAHPPARAAFSG